MNHQSEKSGMDVENPLELQMLFGDKIFLDERDSLIPQLPVESAQTSESKPAENPDFPILFFLDLESTPTERFGDIRTLLGKMLLVTQFDGKVPTMDLAEVIDLKGLSELQFLSKVNTCRKAIIFSDQWPFQQNVASNMNVFPLGENRIFYAPSVSSIMVDIELKRAFAAALKNYFQEV